ncbi:MAG TPA: GNAT family N-acetyltransferase [Trueperaceae bacterium]|nr:GNAT family N-acetyltransferase [Trueperaceae bacterium]
MAITIVRPDDTHRAAWETLYAGYAKFYEVAQTPDMRARVWTWIGDPGETVECFLALADGVPVGLAHFREFARPLAASRGCYLDDLFVEPSARGGGVADALFTALGDEARRRGWSVIRWITADDNYRARGLYDKVAARTPWVTYDLTP